MYTYKFKLWLDKEGKVFGKGPYELLQGIEETGSLMQSAKKLGMSYSQAHGLLKRIEEKLGFTLICSKAGGAQGGGSILTDEAKTLMAKYNAFYEEANEMIDMLYKKHFE
ncbi:winged helix-turn-helix domain-containing protein [Desulfitibacter alkalitolerans]|uniref:winged helix-turn-helix domain-containing protein n=1 Tax=Desulfitibacter alkalitolerans TaxID=264641 RepID=UPI00048452ED|nr:LysR family transcriptional regulator [Desulfitibacter alkalitolerans]